MGDEDTASSQLGTVNGRLWRNPSHSSLVTAERSRPPPLQRKKSKFFDEKADDHVKALSDPRSFCKTSTIHGLRFWPSYPHQPSLWIVVRLCWVVLTLTACGVVVYFTYDAFDKFFQFKTTTHLSFKLAPSLPFPAVTVCNYNPLRWNAVLAGYAGRNISLLPNLYLLCSFYKIDLADVPECGDEKVMKLAQADNRTMGEIFATFGHRINESIPDIGPPMWFNPSCTYTGTKCSSANFTHVNTEYGNCFTFNAHANSSLISRSQGQKSGLEVILNVEQPEYFSRGTTAVGMAVYIHPPHRPILAYHGQLALVPGTENFIALRASKTVRQPEPFNGPDYCVKESDGRKIMQYYPDYSLLGCKNECRTTYVFAKCKCRLPEMPALTVEGQVMRQCTLYEGVSCGETWRDLFESDVEAQARLCSRCQEPCNETGYQYTLSHSAAKFLEYSNAAAMDAALLDIGIDVVPNYYDNVDSESILNALRESMIKIVVYFDDLNFEEVMEIPVYETVSLFGDIGGNLGLFLGASLLTVFELVQFALAYTHERVSLTCTCNNHVPHSRQIDEAEAGAWKGFESDAVRYTVPSAQTPPFSGAENELSVGKDSS